MHFGMRARGNKKQLAPGCFHYWKCNQGSLRDYLHRSPDTSEGALHAAALVLVSSLARGGGERGRERTEEERERWREAKKHHSQHCY